MSDYRIAISLAREILRSSNTDLDLKARYLFELLLSKDEIKREAKKAAEEAIALVLTERKPGSNDWPQGNQLSALTLLIHWIEIDPWAAISAINNVFRNHYISLGIKGELKRQIIKFKHSYEYSIAELAADHNIPQDELLAMIEKRKKFMEFLKPFFEQISAGE